MSDDDNKQWLSNLRQEAKGVIQAEQIRIAGERLEAQRQVGAAAIAWQLVPRHNWVERARAKDAYRRTLASALRYYQP